MAEGAEPYSTSTAGPAAIVSAWPARAPAAAPSRTVAVTAGCTRIVVAPPTPEGGSDSALSGSPVACSAALSEFDLARGAGRGPLQRAERQAERLLKPC